MLRNNIKISINVSLFILMTLPLLSQNIYLNDISSKYKSLQSWHVETKTSIYKNVNDSKPFNVVESKSFATSNGVLIKNGSFEILMNPKCSLIIDHKEKTIQYSNSNENNIKAIRLKNKPDVIIDTSNKNYENSILELDNGDILLESKSLNPKNEIKSAKYYFEKETFKLKKIIYLFNEKSIYRKAVIEYSVFDMSPNFNSDFFSESKFIIGNGPKASLQKKYASYEFFNQYGKTLKDYLNEN